MLPLCKRAYPTFAAKAGLLGQQPSGDVSINPDRVWHGTVLVAPVKAALGWWFLVFLPDLTLPSL
jgi:hypothetical protein